jgi:hypothetical protein
MPITWQVLSGADVASFAQQNLLQTEKVDRDGAIPFTGPITGTSATFNNPGSAIAQNAWTEVLDVSMSNSWVNFGGTSVNSVGYYRDSLGRVKGKGVIKSGTIGSAALTLPAEYRPSRRCYFAAVSNGAFGFFTVEENGDVIPQAGNNTYFSLDQMDFRVA